jgi:3-oxoacyl-[acyl-carrier-protein] synthase II
MRRIAVSGIGLICPLGRERDGAWARLMAGDSAVARLSLEGLPDIAAAPAPFDPNEILTRLQQVGADRASVMALGAARAAMADAGIAAWSDPERAGLYVGTGLGGAATMDAGYAALYQNRRVPPLTVPAGMVNGPAAIVALHTVTRGPVITYAVACASAAVAIIEAGHALRRGEIDVALVGGAEALLVRGTVAAWQALRTLAAPIADVARSCRPFSPDRDGLVLGEGAAFLVLEREADAAARGHAPRAWLSGGATRCDAMHLTTPDRGGQIAALRAALASAGLAPADIGYCNAHGTATVAGDPVECDALRSVWGDAAPALRISSTKAAHGHLLGAAGALEAIWTVAALERGELPPTQGVQTIATACEGLGHVLGHGERAPGLRHAISNSFAFGGTNAVLVFSKA